LNAGGTAAFTLNLKPSLMLLEEAGQAIGLEEPGGKRLRLGAGCSGFLRLLAQGGCTEEACCAGSRECRYLLARLEQEGWIGYGLAHAGRPLATLVPMAPPFRLRPILGPGPWRLSRFAWLRRQETGALALETPLGHARVLLWAPEPAAALAHLAQPRDTAALAADTGLEPPCVQALLTLLASAGAVAPCADDGSLPEDRDPALRQWEFHDLLFHSRSRPGRNDDPVGGTCRFLGALDPLPALKVPGDGPVLALPEPGPPPPGPSFFQVLAARRSRREPGPEPISLAQLGTFLHHVARVREVVPPDPEAGRFYEAALGPCPGGGGMHELELYVSVARCAGLESGFYHYDAGSHALERWPGSGTAWDRLLRQGQTAMGAATRPDLLFTLAARIQRMSWKYQGIAYALILKDAGVLLQQMYLVAAALGLAPCAIGTGDTETFAHASGLPFAEETSVGEFALSG
jgi:SagB-type dehydrogenase family enzyme